MNYALNIEKLAEIIEDARDFGLTVLPPDINRSGIKCSVVDDKTILFGLSNIKGLGVAAMEIIEERERKPFSDIKDFLLRGANEKVTQTLIDAGAFDAMGYSRKSISLDDEIMKDICSIIKKVKEKQKFVENAKRVLEFITEYDSVDELKERISNEDGLSFQITSKKVPTVESIQNRIYNAQDVIKELLNELNNGAYEPCSYDTDEDDIDTSIFSKEKDVLGVYLTGHPINFYETSYRVNICDITEKSRQVSGIITNIEIKLNKYGKRYARFVLEDNSGSIKCAMFGQDFEDYENELIDGTGVRVVGKVKIDDFASTEDEIKYQLTAEKITKLPKKAREYELILKDEFEYAEILSSIKKYENSEGHSLYVIFKTHAGECYIHNNKVSKNIIELGANVRRAM